MQPVIDTYPATPSVALFAEPVTAAPLVVATIEVVEPPAPAPVHLAGWRDEPDVHVLVRRIL